MRNANGERVIDLLNNTVVEQRDSARSIGVDKLKMLLFDINYVKGCADAGLEAIQRRNAIILQKHHLEIKHKQQRNEPNSA